MGAEFRGKNRLIKFLRQNPHFTCVLCIRHLGEIGVTKLSITYVPLHVIFPWKIIFHKQDRTIHANEMKA